MAVSTDNQHDIALLFTKKPLKTVCYNFATLVKHWILVQVLDIVVLL